MNQRANRRQGASRRRAERSRLASLAAIAWFVTALGASHSVIAASPSSLACDGAQPQPPYGLVGEAPAVQAWSGPTLAAAPAGGICIGWSTGAPRLVVAVAGRFRDSGGADGLMARFGAISDLVGVRYWSVTDGSWRPLVASATALTGAASGQPRADFSAEEMRSSRDVYLAQRDSRSASEAVYRMRVRESTFDRFVIESGNVTSIRWWGLTLFGPGDIHSVYFLQQQEPGIWSYYAVTTIAGSSWFTAGHDKSYVNRMIALYRHTAGIPSDLEPPAAP
jgi:hypothetical protein